MKTVDNVDQLWLSNYVVFIYSSYNEDDGYGDYRTVKNVQVCAFTDIDDLKKHIQFFKPGEFKVFKVAELKVKTKIEVELSNPDL